MRDKLFCAPSKIGVSTNPGTRFGTLQTSCPNQLKLFRTFRLPSRKIALDIEDCFHTTHKTERLQGEWFDVSPHDAAAILSTQIRWAIGYFTTLNSDELELAYELVGVND